MSHVYFFIVCAFLGHLTLAVRSSPQPPQQQRVVKQQAALGRVAHLGFAYDAVRDSFFDLSLLKAASGRTNLPPGLVKSHRVTDKSDDCHLSFNNSFERRFSQLGVDAQLKLSVLGDLLSSGSGDNEESDSSLVAYLSQPMESRHTSLQANLVYRTHTVDEELALDVEASLSSLIDERACWHAATCGLTHVVVGIRWGATLIASFEYNKRSEGSATTEDDVDDTIRGHMSLMLDTVVAKCALNASSVSVDEQELKDLQLNVRLYSDYGDVRAAPSFEEALTLMRRRVRESNSGKGVPLEYTLMSLEHLSLHVSSASRWRSLLFVGPHESTECVVSRVQLEFERLAEAKQRFRDLLAAVRHHRAHFPFAVLSEFARAKSRFVALEATFRSELKSVILRARTQGNDDESRNSSSSDLGVDVLRTLADDVRAFVDVRGHVERKLSMMLQLAAAAAMTTTTLTFLRDSDTIDDWRLLGKPLF